MERPSPLPSFIIGGAPRSGTTFLCHALDRHPDIYVAKPYIPEPKVFMTPLAASETYNDRYRACFAPANGHRVLCEKTSYYLESESACSLIASELPSVLMLFIVREPAGRAYSNYLRTKSNGLETLSFEEALTLEGSRECPLPAAKAYARPFDYATRSDYASLADRYITTFGRDRVKFVLYEDIQRRPEEMLREVQEFVGVEPLPFAQLDVGVVNSVKESGPPIDPNTEAQLRRRLAPSVARFARMTGLDVSPWGY